MNIGLAASASGVSAKMIRHYEAIGLIPAPARRTNAYRDYGAREVRELRFIGQARRLGFSIDEIGQLLALWRDKSRPSRQVRAIAAAHLTALRARIAELQAMADALTPLVGCGQGDERPDCPILDNLAADSVRIDA